MIYSLSNTIQLIKVIIPGVASKVNASALGGLYYMSYIDLTLCVTLEQNLQAVTSIKAVLDID